jgi:hypothetical protein
VSRDLGGNCVLSGRKFDGIVMELDQSCYEKTKTKTYFYHLLLVLQHA